MTEEYAVRHIFVQGQDRPICTAGYMRGAKLPPHDDTATDCEICGFVGRRLQRNARRDAILVAYPKMDRTAALALADGGVQHHHLPTMSDKQLLALMGIGPEMVRRIREVAQYQDTEQPCPTCNGTGRVNRDA